MRPIRISYFSDVLCVWAYVSTLRVEELVRRHPQDVVVEQRFCSIFGDTARKIPATWGQADGYAAFNSHLRHSMERFPEARLNPAIWLDVRPASSMSAHLWLKAVEIAERCGDCEAGAFDAATRAMRQAFFQDARDIANAVVQREVVRQVGVRPEVLDPLLQDGRAHAALASDYQDATAMGVQGSPTFVMNEGRQKLYGNVGYRIIEANIQELLRAPDPEQASWC